MADYQVEKIVDKLQKLRALRRARERVRQLERELHGAPAKHETPSQVPAFLRQDTPFTARPDSRRAGNGQTKHNP